MRYVRKDRRIYHDSHCMLCGSCHGITKGEHRLHAPATCLACGSTQCIGNGLACGTCSVCYIGLLPGWAGTNRQCSYKGCENKAVARADGQNLFRCREHLERGKWKGYIQKCLQDREKHWELIDDTPERFPLL